MEKVSELAGVLPELERTMALLAYENPLENAPSPYVELLQPAHRHQVAAELNAALLRLEHRGTAARLTSVQRMMHWAEVQLDRRQMQSSGFAAAPSGTAGGGGGNASLGGGAMGGAGVPSFPHWEALLSLQSQAQAHARKRDSASGAGAGADAGVSCPGIPMIDESPLASPSAK